MRNYIEKKEVELLFCPLQIQEIKRKIDDFAKEIQDNFQKARVKTQISTEYFAQIANEIDNLDSLQISMAVKREFGNFIKETKPRILKHDLKQLYEVFARRKKCETPFKNSKKQFEYADAFHLVSVLQWVKDFGQECHFVSSDTDFPEIIEERILVYRSLDEFLHFLSEKKNQFLTIESAIAENKAGLENTINKRIATYDFVITDWDFDIISINNSLTSIDQFEIIDIVDIDKASKNFLVTIVVHLTIELDVEISYPDFESSPYDSEDKEYIWIEKSQRMQENSVEVSGVIELEFNDGKMVFPEPQDIDINDGREIELDVIEDYY